MDCKRPELGEKAGKTGEVGLPAPSRLAHSPVAQRGHSLSWSDTEFHAGTLVFRVREKARGPRSFRMRKLLMWAFCTFGQQAKVPWRKPSASLSVFEGFRRVFFSLNERRIFA